MFSYREYKSGCEIKFYLLMEEERP